MGIVVLAAVQAVMLLIGLTNFIVTGPTIQLPLLATFAVAFLIGFAGAVVYLAVLFATDSELSALTRIWENAKLPAG